MKYFLLIISLLLINCTGKKVPTVGNWQQESEKSDHFADSLILDGKPYIDEGKAYRKDEAPLITYMHCNFSLKNDESWHSFKGMEQLENLNTLVINFEEEFDTVDLTPLASLSNLKTIALLGTVVNFNKFKGLKQLVNLEELSIYWEGDSLAKIDFSPLASLPKLKKISFDRQITCLPDLTKLINLQNISIGNLSTSVLLKSLEGIGAPNVRRIYINNRNEIDSFAPLNNLVYLEYLEYLSIDSPEKKEYKIADMENLPNLKYLFLLIAGKIDLHGIEKLSALEELWLVDSEPFNIEGIGKLSNLENLGINFISQEPSLEFMRGMLKIRRLTFYADKMAEGRSGYSLSSTDAYQILDVKPLETLKNLESLQCRNFIIKNISALDVFTLNFEIDVISSRLFDKTEKSKHNLVFESHKE